MLDKKIKIYDEFKNELGTIPADYVMSDELEGIGISGGSFLQNIPIIGPIAKIFGLGLEEENEIKLLGKIKGLGTDEAYLYGDGVHGGFLSAILPFIPTILSAIPAVLDLIKGKGFDEEDKEYELEFINGDGFSDFIQKIKTSPFLMNLIMSNADIIYKIKDKIIDFIKNKINKKAPILADILKNKPNGKGIQQGLSQINLGQGVSGRGVSGKGVSGKGVSGIGQSFSGVPGNGISGKGFEDTTTYYGNKIGEI